MQFLTCDCNTLKRVLDVEVMKDVKLLLMYFNFVNFDESRIRSESISNFLLYFSL